VTCTHCQTEIADKALICYRCGRSTTEPRVPPPSQGSIFEKRRRSWTPLVVVIVILVLLLLAGFFLLGQAEAADLFGRAASIMDLRVEGVRTG